MLIDSFWLEVNGSRVILPDGTMMFQHKEGQRISTDNELFNQILINRLSPKNEQKLHVLELGLGSGINTIMLKKRFPSWAFTGIEIDLEQVLLAQYNCNLLKLKIDVIQEDLRKYTSQNKYDLIIANPPYVKMGQGRMSPVARRNQAKFEVTCTMEDVFACVERNINDRGQAWLLYASDREEDLKAYLENKKIKLIEQIKINQIIISGFEYVASK